MQRPPDKPPTCQFNVMFVVSVISAVFGRDARVFSLMGEGQLVMMVDYMPMVYSRWERRQNVTNLVRISTKRFP